MNKTEKLKTGTSGWHYSHWKGAFYPEDIKNRDMLEYYADNFGTAEINNSFYRLPDIKTMKNWASRVPKGFLFAMKASRYITHMKKLRPDKNSIKKLMRRHDALGSKKGPILFQMPGKFGFNGERLETFLKALPKGKQYAFEFRDKGWFRQETYEILSKAKAALCIYHFKGYESRMQTTADYVYVRLHGPAGAYEGEYGKKGLKKWAKAVSEWLRQGKKVYFYFDNDQNGYAPKDAMRLLEMAARHKGG